jgi:hypothetical protein
MQVRYIFGSLGKIAWKCETNSCSSSEKCLYQHTHPCGGVAKILLQGMPNNFFQTNSVLYICVYIYICMYIYVYIYIHMYVYVWQRYSVPEPASVRREHAPQSQPRAGSFRFSRSPTRARPARSPSHFPALPSARGLLPIFPKSLGVLLPSVFHGAHTPHVT